MKELEYVDKLLDQYTDLCLNKINNKSLYSLIVEISSLVEYKIENHIGVIYSEIKLVKRLINSDDLSSCISGIHAFFQLHHSHNLSFGTYVLIHFNAELEYKGDFEHKLAYELDSHIMERLTEITNIDFNFKYINYNKYFSKEYDSGIPCKIGCYCGN